MVKWLWLAFLPVQPVVLSLVTSLVLSRLDYGSVTLNGITRRLMDRLQSVLNAAERLVYISRKYDRITPLLWDLHWLRVPERIQFRLAVLVSRCRNQTHLSWIPRDRLQWADDDIPRRRLRSATTHKLVVRRTWLRTIGDSVLLHLELEQSAYRRHHRTVRRHLQTASEDLPVCTIFWRQTNCYICSHLSSKLRFTA